MRPPHPLLGRRRATIRACAVSLTIALLLGGCTQVRTDTPTPSRVVPSTSTQTPTQSPTPTPSARPTLVATKERLGGGPLNAALARLAGQAVAEHADLVLPAGRYPVTGTTILPPGTVLRLDAKAEITGDLPAQPLLRVSARSSVIGGTLRNTAVLPGFDLDFAAGARTVTVDGVMFSGESTNALYIAAARVRDVTIQNSRFVGVGYGILLNPGAIDAVGVTIRGNTFRDVCADSIEINASTGGTDRRVRTVRVTGNDIGPSCGAGDSSGFGIGLAGVAGFDVGQNDITGARNEAVHLEDGTSDGRVDGNRITSGGSGSRPAIAVYRTTADVIVQQNRIDGFEGSGIAVLWDSVGSARSISILDNSVQRVTGDGVVVAGDRGTGPFRVARNMITSVGGNGISIDGSHASSVITDNSLEAIGRTPISQALRGTGRTTLERNVIGP